MPRPCALQLALEAVADQRVYGGIRNLGGELVLDPLLDLLVAVESFASEAGLQGFECTWCQHPDPRLRTWRADLQERIQTALFVLRQPGAHAVAVHHQVFRGRVPSAHLLRPNQEQQVHPTLGLKVGDPSQQRLQLLQRLADLRQSSAHGLLQ